MKKLTLGKAKELLGFLKGKAANGDITISQENYLQAVELAVMVLSATPAGYLFTSPEGGVLYAPVDWPISNMTLQGAVYSSPQPANVWIKCSDHLPRKVDNDYQVVALCAKEYLSGNYVGEPKRTIVQDWVIRSWPLNFTHWMPLPANPKPEVL